jgi:hypothetical protein
MAPWAVFALMAARGLALSTQVRPDEPFLCGLSSFLNFKGFLSDSNNIILYFGRLSIMQSGLKARCLRALRR